MKIWQMFANDRTTWVQEYWAAIRIGDYINHVDLSNPRANCFCIDGALRRKHNHPPFSAGECPAYEDDRDKLANRIIERGENAKGPDDDVLPMTAEGIITEWNDRFGRTVDQVIELCQECDV